MKKICMKLCFYDHHSHESDLNYTIKKIRVQKGVREELFTGFWLCFISA